MTEFPWPIAMLAFSRPHYFAQVLKSLKSQSVRLDPRNVHLVLDGYRSRISNAPIAPSSMVEENIALFRSEFPDGPIVYDAMNHGVALNFARAEHLIFEELRQEAGVFLEDDLVLGNHYLEALSQLLVFALRNELVAYVACYGDHRKRLSDQLSYPGKIIRMDHKWGFGLTRRQYLAQGDFLRGYLDIVGKRDYRDRDHEAVFEYFSRSGFSSRGTGQDAAKDVASCILGRVKVMSQACFGKYIGREGLHATQQLYDDMGFQNTELMMQWPIEFELPTDGQLRAWVKEARDEGASIVAEQHSTLNQA